jgi:hypothetical protein
MLADLVALQYKRTTPATSCAARFAYAAMSWTSSRRTMKTAAWRVNLFGERDRDDRPNSTPLTGKKS